MRVLLRWKVDVIRSQVRLWPAVIKANTFSLFCGFMCVIMCISMYFPLSICVSYHRFGLLWSWSHRFPQDSLVCHRTLCPSLYKLSSQDIPTHQGNSLESCYLYINPQKRCGYIIIISLNLFHLLINQTVSYDLIIQSQRRLPFQVSDIFFTDSPHPFSSL